MLMPALFNRMSSRPISRLMNSPIRRTAAGSVRSPGWTWAVPPVPRIHPATSSSGASRRPVSTIVAPSPASAMAAASPMPLPPPVTQTTLSASLGTPDPRFDCRRREAIASQRRRREVSAGGAEDEIGEPHRHRRPVGDQRQHKQQQDVGHEQELRSARQVQNAAQKAEPQKEEDRDDQA